MVKACREAALECGAVVWRNNQGRIHKGGRMIVFGLGKGSGDLIGITVFGRFLSIECKLPKTGRVSDDQKDWRDMINGRGGVAIIATCREDVIEALS